MRLTLFTSSTPRVGVFSLMLSACVSLLTGAEPAFQRPGTLHTATDLDAAHARARSGRIPWTAAWDALLAEAEEFLSQKPSAPVQYSVPARYQDAEGHQRERNRLSSQSRAAYSLALASQLLSRSERPGDQERSERYARHALSILNEWADKNRDMGADADPFVRRETALVTATSGGGLLIAADLLYHHPAWSEKARQTFLSWIREYVLPATAIKTISYNNNWNAWGNYLSLLCAHLLEDPEIFQSDVALWKNDLFHHIVEDGRMPKELARGGGRNWYTYYALLPITTAAVVIHNSTGENLLEPGTRTGDRVKAGLDYFFDNLKGHIYRSLIEASGDLYRDEAYMEWNKGSRPVLGNRAHTGWVHPTLFTTWEDMPVNHPPVASVSGPEGPVAPGTPVRLDASASEDPDGGELTFNWFLAGERRVDEFYEPLLSSGDLIYFREPLNGPFDIYFTITMLENTDMLVGLQSSNRSGFEWGSSSFQVNTNNGRFQVRDGNRYRALEDISYAPGIPYQLRWSVDPAAKTYSVRVREMEDGDWVHLASDFRPRDGNDDFVDMAKIIYSGREGALIQDIEVHTLGKNFPGPVLNFTPATPGEHVVQLTVTDELGAIDTRKITVKVEDHLP